MRARDNPFATAHVHRIRYRFDGLDWDDFMRRLAAADYRGAIVGPEGSGKTTLLEDLEPRLQALGFTVVNLRLTQEFPHPPDGFLRTLRSDISSRRILLVDGAEQISRWSWWKFRRQTRRAGGLIVTAHRPGLLTTVLECGTTPQLLGSIVEVLLANDPLIAPARIENLFRKHRGNLRDALRELYDLYAAEWNNSGVTEPAGDGLAKRTLVSLAGASTSRP